MFSISVTVILIGVVVTALIFALSNGLHDASSVVATFIVCGAATPKQAIGVASIFGMIGAVLGGSAVADTVSKVIDLPVNSSILVILLAAMLGAVIWNLVTWRLGLPSSSTHALIGGIMGAVWVSSGYKHILSHKKNFMEFLRSFVKKDWVDLIKEENLILIDKEFIQEDFNFLL